MTVHEIVKLISSKRFFPKETHKSQTNKSEEKTPITLEKQMDQNHYTFPC